MALAKRAMLTCVSLALGLDGRAVRQRRLAADDDRLAGLDAGEDLGLALRHDADRHRATVRLLLVVDDEDVALRPLLHDGVGGDEDGGLVLRAVDLDSHGEAGRPARRRLEGQPHEGGAAGRIDGRRPGDDAGLLVGEGGAAHRRRVTRRDAPQVARGHRGLDLQPGRVDDAQEGVRPPAETMSPTWCERATTTPSKGARTTSRPASWPAADVVLRVSLTVAFARARSRRASSTSLRAAMPRWSRPERRVTFCCAVLSWASARARSERRAAASASRLGIWKRTSSSPRRTRSPTDFVISAMRASCGGVTSSSAPAAGFTWPVALITGRMGPEIAVATVTGTASAVSTASGEAL